MITYDDSAKPKGVVLIVTYVLASIVWLLSVPAAAVISPFE